MRAIFSGLVVCDMTAMKGSPSSRAMCASLIAVEPEDASVTVVPGPIQPLQMA